MPDITKCDNSDCPSCTICWRFMAVPDASYQSYGAFKPDGDRCSSFWPMGGCMCIHCEMNIPGDALEFVKQLQEENDRLTAEVARLKCGLWQSKDHRIGLLKESFENIVDNYSNFDCRRWRSMMSDIIKISKAALEI